MKKLTYLLTAMILFIATSAYANGNGYPSANSFSKEDLGCDLYAPQKKHSATKHRCKYQAPIKQQQVANIIDDEYQPGPYLGGQVGWGRIDEGDGYKQYINNLTAITSKNIELGTFIAWRGVVGYSFVPFFSVEAGYSYYPDNTYISTGDVANTNNINIRTYTIDLVGKLILPLGKIAEPFHRFSIYVKGGGSYLNTKIEETLGTTYTEISNNAIRPTYGAGIAFNFTDNISVDASWTGIYGKKRVTSSNGVVGGNPTPHCNMFALGIYYKITGLY